MILVTGTVQARPETLDAVLAASLEHVRRSREEPGCLLHSVHQDVEDPLRVGFLEHWRDAAALAAHFAVPASVAFVEAVAGAGGGPAVPRGLRGPPHLDLTRVAGRRKGTDPAIPD